MSDWIELSNNSTSWDKVKPIQGVFVQAQTGVGPNKSNMYMLRTKDGMVGVWGSTVLDSKFAQIPVGAEVYVESLGTARGKTGKEYADYKVKYRLVPLQEVGGLQSAASDPDDAPPVSNYEDLGL